MASLLSIPLIEEEGCHIEYASNMDRVVKTPQGVLLPLKRDTGLNQGMTYIDMRERKEGSGMIQSVRKNFDNFTGKYIDK